MISILTFVVFCEILGLLTPFVRSCWGHAMSKCCQHVADDSKVCLNLTLILIKDAQSICRRSSHGPKKVLSDGNNGKTHVQMWGCLYVSSRHLWRLNLFQNSSYSRKLLNSNFLLQKSTIIGISRLCAKSLSLGNCLNYFWYIEIYGPTMLSQILFFKIVQLSTSTKPILKKVSINYIQSKVVQLPNNIIVKGFFD
jgi:hypothetical protein